MSASNTNKLNLRLEQGFFNPLTVSAVSLLVCRYPPFFHYEFGLMMSKLTDQLKNSANVLVIQDEQIVAYAGWIVVKDADAQKWMADGGELPTPDWIGGDAAIVTIAVTNHRAFLRPLIRAISHVCAGKKGYRMRSFQNGKEDVRRPPIKGKTQYFS